VVKKKKNRTVQDTANKIHMYLQVYPEGRMSQTMDKLKIGDKLEFRGPRGRFGLELNEKRALGEPPSNLKMQEMAPEVFFPWSYNSHHSRLSKAKVVENSDFFWLGISGEFSRLVANLWGCLKKYINSNLRKLYHLFAKSAIRWSQHPLSSLGRWEWRPGSGLCWTKVLLEILLKWVVSWESPWY
jgi:hypothetical protein